MAIVWLLNRRFKKPIDPEARRFLALLAGWIYGNLNREQAGLSLFTYQEYLDYVFGAKV